MIVVEAVDGLELDHQLVDDEQVDESATDLALSIGDGDLLFALDGQVLFLETMDEGVMILCFVEIRTQMLVTLSQPALSVVDTSGALFASDAEEALRRKTRRHGERKTLRRGVVEARKAKRRSCSAMRERAHENPRRARTSWWYGVWVGPV